MTKLRQSGHTKLIVEIEIINGLDCIAVKYGRLDPAEVRRKTVQAIVDPGAARMILPRSIVKELGLPAGSNRIKIQRPNGRRRARQEPICARVRVANREGLYAAVVEPRGQHVVVGMIVLNDLDLVVDRNEGKLKPRDAKYITAEI